MGYKDVKVIVVTQSMDFFSAVRSWLFNAPFTESVLNVGTLQGIQFRFSKGKPYVLIVDLDNVTASAQLFKPLKENFQLTVVFTAKSPATALSFTQQGYIFVVKPQVFTDKLCELYVSSLVQKVKLTDASAPVMNYMSMQRTVGTGNKIIAIAASTGGTEALEKVLRAMPPTAPPILVVQHMPSGFTKLFATRLNSLCPMEVKEAQNNDYLQTGTVLIAPADQHMKLIKRDNKLAVECAVGMKLHGVMPAADVLFESIAPIMRANAIGVILTGMGADGAKGLYLMHINGAKTIGQNQATCVVYGMPKVAFEMGALDEQLPLDGIAARVMGLVGMQTV